MPAQGPPTQAVAEGYRSMALEPMEMDTTALYSSFGPDGATSPTFGVTRSTTKPGSSSSSETKEVETADEEVYSKQMEMLDHMSRDPSMWSAGVLQVIALHHASTTREMNQDPEQDWKLIRNDSLSQSPLSHEEHIRQRTILYTRLDRDIRIPSFIQIYDPSDKSFYFYISNEAGYEQTVNLDDKSKVWERRVESQRSQILGLEKEMTDLLNKLSLGLILRSEGEKQKQQWNRMLNILCTMSVICFKELVYSGLIILNSKDCFKEFEKVKRDREEFFLKTQLQIIKSMYEGLSHLNRNGFYIPQLRKDYFVRDSEKCESEEQLMLQQSKQLVQRLKKAHSERSGILTLENPHEGTAELAQLLGEAKRLKKETPVTYQDLEANNMEEFSNKVAEIISGVMGTSTNTNLWASAATTTLGTSASSAASSMGVTPMIPARLFQTPETTTKPPTTKKTKKSKSLSSEESQALVDEMFQIKRILKGQPAPLNPGEQPSQGQTIRNWVEATPQVAPRSQSVGATPQLFATRNPAVTPGAIPRSAVRFEPSIFTRPQTARKPVLETVAETSGAGKTLTAEDINMDPHFDTPPSNMERRKAVPAKMKYLQEQLQQLRLGPAVASTPLRTPRPFQGIIEPPTPIVKPRGTIPKPGINRTELDDNYRPAVAQLGSARGGIAP